MGKLEPVDFASLAVSSFSHTGSGTKNAPLLLQNHEHVILWHNNYHSSTPYGILGEMFKLKL